MKKGFTLIELLAVIVVLAIILTIAVPQVLNIIENSKRDAFSITADNLLDAADKYLSINYREMKELKTKTFTIENGQFVGDSIPMSGELPTTGTITVKFDDTITMVIKNDRFCATKGKSAAEAIITEDVENCELKEPAPEVCFTTASIYDPPAAYNNDDNLLVYNGDAIGYNENSNAITAAGDPVIILDYDYANPDCSRDLIIPETINGGPVVAINDYAFEIYDLDLTTTSGLTSVEIPDSVTSIGEYAFDGYNSDLDDCAGQLTSIEFPSSITEVRDYAFECNQITNVTIPSSIQYINYGIFWSNKLTNITIEDGIEEIYLDAFANNQLTDLIIPSSVTYIEGGAFSNNQLPDDKAFIYKRNSDGTIDNTFLADYGGAKRDNIVIPSNVTTLGDSSFANSQITSVTIPNSVTTIQGSAFYSDQLTSITIPSSVTTIGPYAFYRNQFTSISIPNNVIEIGPYAFYNNQLTNLTLGSGITTIESAAFASNKLQTLTIPSNVITIKDNAFNDNQLTNVTIQNGVTKIEYYAFHENQLTAIAIPNSVTSIGMSAFKYNYIPQGSLTIDRASGTVTIGSEAFYYNGTTQTTNITPVYLR